MDWPSFLLTPLHSPLGEQLDGAGVALPPGCGRATHLSSGPP